jgi:hypothetical protein
MLTAMRIRPQLEVDVLAETGDSESSAPPAATTGARLARTRAPQALLCPCGSRKPDS